MGRVTRLLGWVAFAATVIMFAVVAFNVAARAIFDATSGMINFMIPGAIELSSYALLLLVFAALPRAVESGTIRVDLLIQFFPTWLRQVLDRLWHLLTAGIAGILTWHFAHRAVETFQRGDATQDLQMPLWLIYGAITICALCLTATSLFLLARRPNAAA